MSTLIVGCGYLGQRVGQRLAARGERVYGSVRTQPRAEPLHRLGIEPVLADVLKPDTLRTLPETERIVFCVGFDRGAGTAMRDVYVNGLRNVVARLAHRPSRFVYTSSTGVYGESDGGWVDEDTPAPPAHESGRVVLDAEGVVRGFGAERTVPTTVLRLAGLYGPARLPRLASLERGEPIPGDPRTMLNLIHVDDAADAVVRALDQQGGDRIYVIADDRPVARGEFFALVAHCAGLAPPRLEPMAGEARARSGESNKRVSNRRMRQELGVDLRYPDVTVGVPAALRGVGMGESERAARTLHIRS